MLHFFFYEYDIHNKKMRNIKKNELHTYNVTLTINVQQGINIYIYIYIYIYNYKKLNNWKVWHKVIQNQLEISRTVVLCFNEIITMVLRAFPWLQYIRLLIVLYMHSLRHWGHSIQGEKFLLLNHFGLIKNVWCY